MNITKLKHVVNTRVANCGKTIKNRIYNILSTRAWVFNENKKITIELYRVDFEMAHQIILKMIK